MNKHDAAHKGYRENPIGHFVLGDTSERLRCFLTNRGKNLVGSDCSISAASVRVLPWQRADRQWASTIGPQSALQRAVFRRNKMDGPIPAPRQSGG